MSDGKIRVLIVDDSVFMRTILKSALTATEGVEVVATAQNGTEGLRKIQQLKPDVVTLDVEMPGMTGLEVLEKTMSDAPLPIVMVSTKTQSGTQASLDALRLGAVECVAKPVGEKSATLESFRADVVRAVRTASQSNRRTLRVGKQAFRPVEPTTDAAPDAIVAIGISAGGPATLHQMVPTIPKRFPPIVITQHMPADFTGPFAKRIDAESKLDVREATDGQELRQGLALIAPGDRHLRVTRRGSKLVASLDAGPKVSGFRPSVDVMFESVASAVGDRAVGVIMTGMGFDGAAGTKILKSRGAFTIAQDKETSIVYGMPKAAAETNCVDRIVPLSDIPSCIGRALREMRVGV